MYCQKCRTPLKTDGSLAELNPATFDLLIGSAHKNDYGPSPTHGVSYPQERKERYDRASRLPQSPIYRRSIPPPKDGNPGMSFIEITQSQIVSPEPAGQQPKGKQVGNSTANTTTTTQTADLKDAPLSWQLQRYERLSSILSAHSDIDHPICVECSSMLLSSLHAKLTSASGERDAYASFLKQLQQAAAKHKDDEQSVNKGLAALKKEEAEALAELIQLEEQKKQLEHELADLEEESNQLERDEEHFWQSRNVFDEAQHTLEADLASLQQKFLHEQKQYEKLQRTNVYNDTFFISHDGNFGTINGLRLGRLPNIHVEWAEINAAWGQTLLLLQTLAERLSFSFHGYRLRPLGSTSRIEKLDYPQQPPETSRTPTSRPTATIPAKVTILELYSSGGTLDRVLHSHRFDQAMIAFLNCLSQLGRHVEKASAAPRDGNHTTPPTTRQPLSRTPSSATSVASTQPMRLPYVIEADRIWSRDRPEEPYSIKLGVGFAPDESFTKACKYVLTCCKYLLAHVSNLDNSKPA